MDPNACQRRIHDAERAGDEEEARAAREDLAEWLRKGGFPPDPLDGPSVLPD